MIKFEKTDVSGWEAAIRGMRNPLESWDKSDSHQDYYDFGHGRPAKFIIGPNDLKLMQNLAKAGDDHAKYLRMINVTCDITAPLYWWKEFDTYKVGTVANSCSTMHKIHAKPFDYEDFSIDHLLCDKNYFDYYDLKDCNAFTAFNVTLTALNFYREKFIETKDKDFWWQMIQLLPSSYNQKRTVQLNYQVLHNMYKSRKNHKLDEWREFCKWCESLPYFKEILLNE